MLLITWIVLPAAIPFGTALCLHRFIQDPKWSALLPWAIVVLIMLTPILWATVTRGRTFTEIVVFSLISGAIGVLAGEKLGSYLRGFNNRRAPRSK
jgi:hypothetical protein